jgi:alpha-1,2-mannosyltransferase
LVAFCCAGKYLVVDNWYSHGDDFAPLYVAAQLVVDGKVSSLYDHHPYLFHVVPPGEFEETAQKIGFKGFLHPYVHLPFAAFFLRPVLSIPYRTMAKILLLINFLSLNIALYLILRLVGKVSNFGWLSFAIFAMAYFFPLRYGLWLGQTSPLIFLGLTSVYCFAHAGYPKTSGCIFGFIISLKITPAFFLVYFLINRKWVVLISSTITLVIIGACSVYLAGWESNVAFLQNIVRLTGLSLASWNNQSLDGYLLRWVVETFHIYNWQLLELPFKMKIVRYVAVLSIMVIWLVILFYSTGVKEENQNLIKFSLTLVIIVILPPISWSHYLLFLVFPYITILTTVIQNKNLSYRTLIITGLILSYMCTSLPPTYFLSIVKFPLQSLVDTYPAMGLPPLGVEMLAEVPLANKIPFPVMSSSGFWGGLLLMFTILIYSTSMRKMNEEVGDVS